MMLTDKQFYTAALDLKIPEMAAAKESFLAGDVKEAERIFAAYVRSHIDYETYFSLPTVETDFTGREERRITAADRVVDGWFAPEGYAHQFKDLEIDWETNQTPNQYCEWVWVLSRHGEFIWLTQAYHITKDEKYVRAFEKIIESWIDQVEFPIADVDNRHYSYSHTGWRTIESGIRMITPWPYAIHTFLRDGYLSDALIVKIFKSIWEHAFHLKNYCSSHNWLIIELTGFLNIACFYPFFDRSAQWKKFVFDRFVSECDVQFWPEGFQYELTTGYHFGVLHDYLLCVDRARAYGIEIPDKMMDCIHRMYHAIIRILQPDRHLPDLNDGSDGSILGYLSQGLSYFPNDEVFRYFVSKGEKGKEPPYHSAVMPYVGHCAMRTGWEEDAIYALFDAAHFGWGHQHEDKLSFNLSAYGKNLLLDGGKYFYDTSNIRRMLCSTLGHNTALVDTFGQRRAKTFSTAEEERKVREKIPSCLAWNFGEDFEVAEGVYNNGYGEALIEVDHERKIIFFKKGLGIAKPFFVLLDTFTPKDGGEHLYEVHFRLGTEPTVENGNSITADHGDGVALTLLSDGKMEVHTAEKEPRFMGWQKVKEAGTDHEHSPAPAVCFVKRGGTEYVATVAYPAKDETCPIASVACDKDSFTITLVDGTVHAFARNAEAFKTYSTAERIEKGMDICMDVM